MPRCRMSLAAVPQSTMSPTAPNVLVRLADVALSQGGMAVNFAIGSAVPRGAARPKQLELAPVR